MNNGWIKIFRQFTDWEWYDDINTKVLFIHLILKCNYEDKKWRGIMIKRGQRVTSYASLSKETGLSVQQVRTSIDKLKLTGEITYQSTSEYSILTVVTYDTFQQDNKPTNRRPTSEQQTTNKRATTKKEREEYKKEKKEKNNKQKFLEYVFLLEEEYEKLIEDFGKEKLEACIKKLDNFIPNSAAAKKYKDHNRVLRGWVSEWYDKDYVQNVSRTTKIR